MARKNFVMKLAKLLIGAAWADGELSNDEVNSMKDLLFTIDELDGGDWRELEVYMDSPVTAGETEALLAEVLHAIRGRQDKALVVETLQRLFESDGEVTQEERFLLEKIQTAVEGVPTGLLGLFAKAVKSALGQRTETCKSTAPREGRIEDYYKNTVYYQLETEMKKTGAKIDLPEADLRKLCLATGLLARISNLDEDISEDERKAMKDVVSADWKLSDRQAELIVRIAGSRTTRGLDYFRLSHGYFDCTTRSERQAFLTTLFKIANAAEKTSFKEIEEIRKIAKSLKLDRDDFIAAKMSVPREDRKGL